MRLAPAARFHAPIAHPHDAPGTPPPACKLQDSEHRGAAAGAVHSGGDVADWVHPVKPAAGAGCVPAG